MPFLLYGHPDEHGQGELPVLVSIVGTSYMFVRESRAQAKGLTPVVFATSLDATNESAKLAVKLRCVEVDTTLDGQGALVSYATKIGGLVFDPVPKIAFAEPKVVVGP